MSHDRDPLYRARRGLRTVDVYRDSDGTLVLAYSDGVLAREEGITPAVAAHRASMLAECLAWIADPGNDERPAPP